jgi:hypothetical protein
MKYCDAIKYRCYGHQTSAATGSMNVIVVAGEQAAVECRVQAGEN